MTADRRCNTCGKPVKRLTKDGLPNGSAWMAQHDKHEMFCSLRCAARYGIRIANRMADDMDSRVQQRGDYDRLTARSASPILSAAVPVS